MALETGVMHQLTIGETTFPVMPMIHLLSTDGLLISFNLLNTTPNIVGICSPPAPIRANAWMSHFKVPDLTQYVSPIKIKPKPTTTANMSLTLGNSNSTSTPTVISL